MEAPTPTTAAAPTTTTPAGPPATSAPTTSIPPFEPTTVPPEPPILNVGAAGPEVRKLEERLSALGYWLGPPDDTFDVLTRQAVYAFQKVNGLAVDGIVGPLVRAALERPVVPTAVGADPTYVEIDKTRQVLLVVREGEVRWVFNTSTGTEKPYQHPSSGEQWADTPPGRHGIDWQIDGVSEGELGPLYRPKFFVTADGIAVHGSAHVPPFPASHGCVRVTKPAMDVLWAANLMPVGSLVVVHGTVPGSDA